MKLKFLTEEKIALTDYQDDDMCCVYCNSSLFKNLKFEIEDYIFDCYVCCTSHYLYKYMNQDANIYFIKHRLI